MSAVYSALLVPRGSPGTTTTGVPLLRLLRSVDEGVNTTWPLPPAPVQPSQRLYCALKVVMNRAAR